MVRGVLRVGQRRARVACELRHGWDLQEGGGAKAVCADPHVVEAAHKVASVVGKLRLLAVVDCGIGRHKRQAVGNLGAAQNVARVSGQLLAGEAIEGHGACGQWGAIVNNTWTRTTSVSWVGGKAAGAIGQAHKCVQLPPRVPASKWWTAVVVEEFKSPHSTSGSWREMVNFSSSFTSMWVCHSLTSAYSGFQDK